ncbi:cytochrome C [Rubrivivax gelatinosus]|nr:cytochrome C [Rubrivivax gelatinosus]MBK1686072.1 cytochrome C [Rubrivivax gelatinosus]
MLNWRTAAASFAAAVGLAFALGLPALAPSDADAASAAAAPASAAALAPGAVPVAPASEAAPTHRPLRDNLPPQPPNPQEPLVFGGYLDAPAFSVVPRKQHLALYPCAQCHKVLPLNRQPRALVAAPHVASLPHGRGRMWCLDCHVAEDRDWLRTVDGRRVDFDQSQLVCGQCHGPRHRDWAFGAHGKRAANWQGERQIYACTHCHDAHDPKIPPREAAPPPPVRAGLERPALTPAHAAPPWQRAASGAR